MASPAPGIVERFKTARHTYTVQRQSNGQLVYRKDGKFTSARSFHSAQNYAVESEPIGTIRFESKEDLASRPINAVAERRKGEWRAGPEASTYDPSVQPGQEITREKAFDLRSLRSQERRFYEFAIRQDADLTLQELRDRFQTWKRLLAEAETPEEKTRIMVEFGWDETE